MKLDVKDKRIIELLIRNCRLSYVNIAKAVNLSKDAVKYRIDKLIKNKMLMNFVTLVDSSKIGYSVYHTYMKLRKITSERHKEIIKKLVKHGNVMLVAECSGKWDFQIAFLARNVYEFDKISRELCSYCGDNLKDYETSGEVMDYKYSHMHPEFCLGTKINVKREDSSFFKDLCNKKLEFMHTNIVDIDKTDMKILHILASDPRISLTDIGKKIKLTSEGVKYRMKNLIKKEVITGFLALPNLFYKGYHAHVMFLQLLSMDKAREKGLINFFQKNKNILYSAKMTGKWNTIIYLMARTPQEFNDLFVEVRNHLADILIDYDSAIALNWYKYVLWPEGVGLQ